MLADESGSSGEGFDRTLRAFLCHIAKDRRLECPDPDDLYALAEGSLSSSRRQDLAAHVEGCAHCTVALARFFRAQQYYEHNREEMIKKVSRRAESLVASTAQREKEASIPVSDRTEPAARQRSLGPLASFLRSYPSVAALIAVSVFLGAWLLYEHGRNAAWQEVAQRYELRNDVAAAFRAGLEDANRLLLMVAQSQTQELLRTVSQIRVLDLRAGTASIPYPTLGRQTGRPMLVSAAVTQYPELRAEYTELLVRWSDVFLQLGDVLLETGKVDDAIRLFEYLAQTSRNTKSFEDRKPLLFALGELYKMSANATAEDSDHFRLLHEKAIAVYEHMLELDPLHNDPRPLHYAGFSYFELRNYRKALQYYDEALRIFPAYAKVYFNKALVYQTMPGLSEPERSKRVQENLQKALELTLDADRTAAWPRPRILFTLAIIYAELGENDKAMEYLEKAMQHDRLYLVRAERERAFRSLRSDARFERLLASYRPTPHKHFGVRHQATFDPRVFHQ